MAVHNCACIFTPFIDSCMNKSFQIQPVTVITNSFTFQIMSDDIIRPDKRWRTISRQPEVIRIVLTPH